MNKVIEIDAIESNVVVIVFVYILIVTAKVDLIYDSHRSKHYDTF